MSKEQKDAESLHQYWSSPQDSGNQPEDYINPAIRARSRMVTSLVKKHTSSREVRIFEIGCNAGRNLNDLYENGYPRLTGIDISPKALECLRETYPEMAQNIQLAHAKAEAFLPAQADGSQDVVFTMAVLAHIHEENEWLFSHMVRITASLLITVEDESQDTWKHFRRCYKDVFEPLGMTQLESFPCNTEEHALDERFVVRVFQKQ